MTPQELNEAVAVKLGWKNLSLRENIGTWDLVGHREGSPPFGETVPDYCRKIEAAWEIVGLLQEQGKSVMLFLGREESIDLKSGECSSEPYVHCQINGGLANSGYCSTAPMAICEAFLKVP